MRLRLCRVVHAAVCLGFLAMPAIADDADPSAAIRQALTGWMDAFNGRDAPAACSLFAPELRYNVQGLPEQTYADMCNRLRRSLSGTAIRYRYALDLQEVIPAGDLAVVRLAWYLTVSRPGVPDVTTPEQGMDVFRRQADGAWKIIRFIAYDARP